MARPQPKFTELECKEIEEALKKEKDKKKYLRLLALKYKAFEGMKSMEVANRTGFHKDYINVIVRKYKENGIQAITSSKNSRNRAYLSLKEEDDFLKPFEAQAEEGHILEVSEIAKEYEKRVDKKVSLVTIYLLLKRHGWRKVMPRSKHPKKADKEAIEAYKKNR